MTNQVQVREEWQIALRQQFDSPWFSSIIQHLKQQVRDKVIFYPTGPDIFKAFDKVAPQEVKVVILGQDPYHNPGEAMGLSFSVPKGVKVPPSLKNVYKELSRDLSIESASHGDLTAWADQGVFLLNAILTVPQNTPSGHKQIGWARFTDEVISYLSIEQEGIVFMLWGNFAKAKRTLIDSSKHLILESAHPSPLAGNAFQGCGHFSKANDYLISQGKSPIDWQLKP